MKNSQKKQMRKNRKNMILQYLQDYRFNSILVKSFVIILVVLGCCFTVIMLMVSNKLNSIIQEQVGTMSINTLVKTQERMDTVMQEVVKISGKLSLDNDVLLFLLPDSNNLLSKNPTIGAKQKIDMYAGVFDYIDSIYIYSKKNNYVVTSEGGSDMDGFKDITWLNNLSEREYEPARMISRLKENNYPYLISYIQPIRLTQMQFLGGIIVNINVEKLGKLVVSNVEESKENLLIVDERNNIIFSSNQNYLMKKINKLAFYDGMDFNDQDGYQIVNYDGQDIVVTIASSDDFKWKYISTVPLSAYKEYQNGFRSFYTMLVLFIVVISALASVVISIYCYTPVKNILNLLKDSDLYANGLQSETGLHKDETHEIALNIIRNLYSNKQMQDEMKNYMSIIDKAQITALQAQISPHFLYNTLENIRWKAIAICKGDNEVSQIILNLSEMLRISLDNEHQIITISEEIKNAKLYIEILQLRYEDKMKVEWEIDENALMLPIVKVSLQPIIENAVYHGIKPLRENGLINISVQRTIDEVIITVKDNGIGMNEEEVDILNCDMNEKYLLKEGHIGIRNVNQRLKLLIGDEAGIEIQSKRDEGTTVILKMQLEAAEANKS